MKSLGEVIAVVLLVIAALLAVPIILGSILAFLGLVIMVTWNISIVPIFELKEITLIQSMGIGLLLWIVSSALTVTVSKEG